MCGNGGGCRSRKHSGARHAGPDRRLAPTRRRTVIAWTLSAELPATPTPTNHRHTRIPDRLLRLRGPVARGVLYASTAGGARAATVGCRPSQSVSPASPARPVAATRLRVSHAARSAPTTPGSSGADDQCRRPRGSAEAGAASAHCSGLCRVTIAVTEGVRSSRSSTRLSGAAGTGGCQRASATPGR
jgi:hypothetical protein